MVNRFESIACEAHVFRERERERIWRPQFLQAISEAG